MNSMIEKVKNMKVNEKGEDVVINELVLTGTLGKTKTNHDDFVYEFGGVVYIFVGTLVLKNYLVRLLPRKLKYEIVVVEDCPLKNGNLAMDLECILNSVKRFYKAPSVNISRGLEDFFLCNFPFLLVENNTFGVIRNLGIKEIEDLGLSKEFEEFRAEKANEMQGEMSAENVYEEEEIKLARDAKEFMSLRVESGFTWDSVEEFIEEMIGLVRDGIIDVQDVWFPLINKAEAWKFLGTRNLVTSRNCYVPIIDEITIKEPKVNVEVETNDTIYYQPSTWTWPARSRMHFGNFIQKVRFTAQMHMDSKYELHSTIVYESKDGIFRAQPKHKNVNFIEYGANSLSEPETSIFWEIPVPPFNPVDDIKTKVKSVWFTYTKDGFCVRSNQGEFSKEFEFEECPGIEKIKEAEGDDIWGIHEGDVLVQGWVLPVDLYLYNYPEDCNLPTYKHNPIKVKTTVPFQRFYGKRKREDTEDESVPKRAYLEECPTIKDLYDGVLFEGDYDQDSILKKVTCLRSEHVKYTEKNMS